MTEAIAITICSPNFVACNKNKAFTHNVGGTRIVYEIANV